MAKSAAPLLLVAGGAALLLMSGKKKKKRSKSACTIVRSYEEFAKLIDKNEYMEYPVSFVFYPEGEEVRGAQLCEALASQGVRTVVVSSAHEAKWAYEMLNSGQMTPGSALPPVDELKKMSEGIWTVHSDTKQNGILWDSIPWDDTKSILSILKRL
jgi:hypothetical protein